MIDWDSANHPFYSPENLIECSNNHSFLPEPDENTGKIKCPICGDLVK